LGGVRGFLFRCNGGVRLCGILKFTNRCEHYPPMPKQDAQTLKVLIGQMRECRNSYPVLGKTLGILGHAELFEPVRNLLHHGPPRCAIRSGPTGWKVYHARRSNHEGGKAPLMLASRGELGQIVVKLASSRGVKHGTRGVCRSPPQAKLLNWIKQADRATPWRLAILACRSLR